MDFQKYLLGNPPDNETNELLARIANVIEQDPSLALFGVSLASALESHLIPKEEVIVYLAEVEARLSQVE